MTGLVYSPIFLAHDTGLGHPERADRLRAIVKQLQASPLWSRLDRFAPEEIGEPDDELLRAILRVHTGDYLNRIQQACRENRPFIDTPDSAICPRSYQVALTAAAGGLEAARRIDRGDWKNAFAALRPPGHHAEANLSMGFCLINHVAVIARYLQATGRAKRIFILDWDVHHGNGTQHLLEEDADVFYCSIHQYGWGFYPGSGASDECGKGPGEGFTLNLPLPAGTGDAEYAEAMDARIVPACRQFRPDFILVSAGFDAHGDDPLASMNLTDAGFDHLARQIRRSADELCGGKLLCCLEGGYDLDALARNVENLLLVLDA